ncbi:hypothetical protein [Marinobacter sp.]|uniref:hypothetical protein n=1 Tax=Marinobacter sp. TaxID=50741 RepID=UPI0035694853
MKSLLVFVCLALLPGINFAQESEESEELGNLAQSMLVVGKMTGNCGILHLQIQFQENTKLEGGAKFITRFWTAEAARLGMSLEEFGKQCNEVVDKYDAWFEAFE